MAAELSQAPTAYEHGDVRAVWAEVTMKNFELSAWVEQVMGAKLAYDAIQSDNAPTDRKLMHCEHCRAASGARSRIRTLGTRQGDPSRWPDEVAPRCRVGAPDHDWSLGAVRHAGAPEAAEPRARAADRKKRSCTDPPGFRFGPSHAPCALKRGRLSF